MTHAQFLRIKKLRGAGIIKSAAKHNLREIAAEIGAAGHIDAARISDNIILRGPDSADAVAHSAEALLADAKIGKLRKDAVRGLEIVFSLPSTTRIDQRQFFDDAIRWAEAYFRVPMLSATIHNDEAAPHAHVLLLPLLNGRMVGSNLMGGRRELQALQEAFYENVGRSHGLTRHLPQRRHSAAVRAAAIAQAFDSLVTNSGLNSQILRALLAPHVANPEPLLLALGLQMPERKVSKQSFVALMTRPCKLEKPIGFAQPLPIGSDDSTSPETNEPYLCVGFAGSTSPLPLPCTSQTDDIDPPQAQGRVMVSDEVSAAEGITLDASQATGNDAHDEPAERFTRERDSDRRADEWDADRGEWGLPISAKPSRRTITATAIQRQLEAMRWQSVETRPATKHF
jgi:hypothetical protein